MDTLFATFGNTVVTLFMVVAVSALVLLIDIFAIRYLNDVVDPTEQ
jgi:hypothetical protein